MKRALPSSGSLHTLHLVDYDKPYNLVTPLLSCLMEPKHWGHQALLPVKLWAAVLSKVNVILIIC